MNTVDHVEYDYLCVKKNEELLRQAIQKDLVPGRLSHIGKTLCTFITPLEILAPIASTVQNIVKLPFSLFYGPRSGLKLFAYRLCRLFALDPLRIVSTLLVIALKIVSAVLGIISPSLAVRGYILAQQIQAANLELKLHIRMRYLHQPELQDPGEIHGRIVGIKPGEAIRYLGEDEALDCRSLDLGVLEGRVVIAQARLDSAYQKAISRIINISRLILLENALNEVEARLLPTLFQELKRRLPREVTIEHFPRIVDVIVGVLDPREDGTALQKEMHAKNIHGDNHYVDNKEHKIFRIETIYSYLNAHRNSLLLKAQDATRIDFNTQMEELNKQIVEYRRGLDDFREIHDERIRFGSVRVITPSAC